MNYKELNKEEQNIYNYIIEYGLIKSQISRKSFNKVLALLYQNYIQLNSIQDNKSGKAKAI